jgi:hypothetical protein
MDATSTGHQRVSVLKLERIIRQTSAETQILYLQKCSKEYYLGMLIQWLEDAAGLQLSF